MTLYYERDGIQLQCGDFREVMPTLEPGSIDAVIADPPYPSEYLKLWAPLGYLSAGVLKKGGSLISIVPHYAMPQVLGEIGKHLKYRWMTSMWQGQGAHPRMAMGIEVMWKPLVWWVKDAWPHGRGFKRDGFINEPIGRVKLHKWQQSTTWADYCLGLAHTSGMVLDPMAGAGTLMVQAWKRGQPALGIELDERVCEVAATRLAEAVLDSDSDPAVRNGYGALTACA